MTQDPSRDDTRAPHDPIARLDAAFAALEAAVARVAGAERSRVDLADTLAIMDDDRQRLAAALDATTAKAQAMEVASEAVEARLHAMGTHLSALLDGMKA